MLPRHRLMAGDDDVAGLEAVPAIAFQPVDHEHAEVRDKVRHATDFCEISSPLVPSSAVQ